MNLHLNPKLKTPSPLSGTGLGAGLEDFDPLSYHCSSSRRHRHHTHTEERTGEVEVLATFVVGEEVRVLLMAMCVCVCVRCVCELLRMHVYTRCLYIVWCCVGVGTVSAQPQDSACSGDRRKDSDGWAGDATRIREWYSGTAMMETSTDIWLRMTMCVRRNLC